MTWLELLYKIISNPPKWLFSLLFFLKNEPKKSILYISRFLMTIASVIIIIGSLKYTFSGISLEKLFFLHKNSNVIQNVNKDSVQEEMIAALMTMGKGASISKVNVGYLNISDLKKTMTFEDVISCGYEEKYCLSSSKLIHAGWYGPKTLEKQDEIHIELNNVEIYQPLIRDSVNRNFGENSPICIDVFEDNKITEQFQHFRKSFPAFSAKLEEVSFYMNVEANGSYISRTCFTKIIHPKFKNVIHIFLFTFWYYKNIKPEMINIENVKRLLKGIGNKEKENLIRLYSV